MRLRLNIVWLLLISFISMSCLVIGEENQVPWEQDGVAFVVPTSLAPSQDGYNAILEKEAAGDPETEFYGVFHANDNIGNLSKCGFIAVKMSSWHYGLWVCR